MIAIGLYNTFGFPHDVLPRFFRRRPRMLYQQITAEFIGGYEGRLRRTPGMEPDMIQAMGLDHANHPLPIIHIGTGITRHGKHSAIQRAPKNCRSPIHQEPLALNPVVHHAK